MAQCLDVDVASQGETEEEALTNLREALELYFEPPRPMTSRCATICCAARSEGNNSDFTEEEDYEIAPV